MCHFLTCRDYSGVTNYPKVVVWIVVMRVPTPTEYLPHPIMERLWDHNGVGDYPI